MKSSIRNAAKKQVMKALDMHSEMQANLSSESCRESIAFTIITEIEKHFSLSPKPFLPIDFDADTPTEDEFGN